MWYWYQYLVSTYSIPFRSHVALNWRMLAVIGCQQRSSNITWYWAVFVDTVKVLISFGGFFSNFVATVCVCPSPWPPPPCTNPAPQWFSQFSVEELDWPHLNPNSFGMNWDEHSHLSCPKCVLQRENSTAAARFQHQAEGLNQKQQINDHSFKITCSTLTNW